MSAIPMVELPRIPAGDWFDSLVDWANSNLGPLLDGIELVLETLFDTLSGALLAVPPLVLAVVLAALALLRGWRFALVSLVGLLLVQSLRMWEPGMETLAMVLVASGLAMVIAIPVGILSASSDAASRVIRPVLDFMQTMPAFVYLIPVIFFFSIGPVPGMVATIVFAMPPGVRLTELGIRQVDHEMVEAGHAFGAPGHQILSRIQIPLALPTIMAGVNQVIMLSLSMVVIAGFVGAGGLGGVIVGAVTRVELGIGFEGGLAVVILAIYLDRMTSALADRSKVARARRKAAAAR